jgi:DsbC/DsbD-like thiol-disulfide interchange protein
MRCRLLAAWLALGLGCQKPPADGPEAAKPPWPAARADTASARPAEPVLVEEPTADNPFVAKAALRPTEGSGGDTVDLVIQARTAPGWHIYAAGESPGGAVPTSVEVRLPRGVEPAGPWQYPRAEPGQEGQGGIYQGQLLFRRPLKITQNAQRGAIEVQCELTYQACDPFRCRPPETLTLSAKGEVLSR